MDNDLFRLLDASSNVRVLVIGDAILDGYFEGSTTRLCREAPVPIVAIDRRSFAPGGAANTAANVAGLNGQAVLLSVIGEDLQADLLCGSLEARGLSTEHLFRVSGRRTLSKSRIIADAQMLVRFDEGSENPIDPQTEQRLIGRLIDLVSECDAVIVSDYGGGILSATVMKALADVQRRSPRVLTVDSRRRLECFREIEPTAVKPNYAEALRLIGHAGRGGLTRAEFLTLYGKRLLEMTGSQLVAVTLDAEGAVFFERNRPPYRTYAKSPRPVRATGAGDTFLGALTLALAAGAHAPAAAELASAAAAVVVGKEGTAVCSSYEVREHLSSTGKMISDVCRLVSRGELYRQQGRRLVFTNGCFDLLHRGHITYLSQAKTLGDVLIVGVNSDEGVRRLKGPGRPINSLPDRMQVLAALSCIDHLIAFEGDTPEDLLKALHPDVYVKGGDYTRETLPEARLVEGFGGTIRFLPYVEDQSTTGIIERIRDTRGSKSRSRKVKKAGDLVSHVQSI